jgi:hypothetical protein
VIVYNAHLIVLATLLLLPVMAYAACTEKDQEDKVAQLGALMTPLSQKDPARAQKISEGMQSAMMLDGDAACASLDKLIAQAK